MKEYLHGMKVKSDDLGQGFLDDENEQIEVLKSDIRLAIKDSFNFNKKPDEELNELFTLIQLIDNVLSSNITLTKQQTIDYCTSQRYFMKLYMKIIMAKNSS